MLKKLFHWKVFAVLGVFALLVITAGVIIFYNLESIIKNNKETIVAQIEQAIDRDVAINDLEATIGWSMGIRLNQFSIAEDPAFGQGQFVRADFLQLNLKVVPLFFKKIEISNFELKQPVIQIIKNKDGTYNFSSLARTPESDAPPADATAPAPGEDSASAPSTPVEIALSRLIVTDGAVQYTDPSAQQNIQLNDVDVEIVEFSLDRPFSTSVQLAYGQDKQNIEFRGDVGPLAHSTDPLSIDGTLAIKGFPAETLTQMPAIQGSLPDSLNVKGLLNGTFQLKGGGNSIAVQGALNADATDIRWSELLAKSSGVPLQSTLNLVYSDNAIDLKQLTLQLLAAVLEGKGNIQFAKNTTYQIELTSKPFELKPFHDLVPLLKTYNASGTVSLELKTNNTGKTPVLQGTVTLGEGQVEVAPLPEPITNIKSKIQFNQSSASIEPTTLRIGESNATVQADIRQFSPARLDYELSSPAMAVSDFMQVTWKTNKPDVLREVQVQGSASMTADGAAAKGTLVSKQGSFYNLDFSDLSGTYSLEKQVIRVSNLRLNVLNGQLTGDAVYDMNQDPPAFQLNTKAQELDLVEYVRQSVVQLPKSFKGRLNFGINLSGQGTDWKTLYPTLDGSAAAEILDGVLFDTNIVEAILGGMTGLPGVTELISPNLKDEYPTVFASRHTVFDQLKFSSRIQQGVMNIETLLVSAADWVINGKGKYDLGQGLDSDAILQLSKGFSAYLAGKVNVLQHLVNEQGLLTIPFTMSGVLPSVKPSPNADILQNYLQQALLGKGIKKLEETGLSNILKDSPLGGILKPAPSGETKSATQAVPAPADKAVESATSKVQAATPEVQAATTEQKLPAKPEDLKKALPNMLKNLLKKD